MSYSKTKRCTVSAVAYAAVLMGAACNSFDPDLGTAPFKCGLSEPRCPETYDCVQTNPGVEVCLAANQNPDDLPDGSPTGFQCNNDSELEPNDTVQSATQTGIPEQSSQRFVGLAVCPQGDIDMFAFRINPGGFATVTSTLEVGTGTGPLSLFLLNDQAGGQEVAEGTPNPLDSTKISLSVTSVPAGNYFIRVNGNGSGENNFNLDVAIQQ